MKVFLAYTIVTLVGGVIASIPQLFLMQLNILLIERGVPRFLVSLVNGILTGIVALWFANLIFSWFSLPLTVWVLLLLVVKYLYNDIKRIRTRANIGSEIGYLIGDIAGLTIGAMYLFDVETSSFIAFLQLLNLEKFLLLSVAVTAGFLATSYKDVAELNDWPIHPWFNTSIEKPSIAGTLGILFQIISFIWSFFVNPWWTAFLIVIIGFIVSTVLTALLQKYTQLLAVVLMVVVFVLHFIIL